MAPKTNKQREKLEQSQASSRAKAHQSMGGAGGFVGFSSFAKPTAESAAPVNPFASFAVSGSGATAGDEYSGGGGAASAIYDGGDHEIAMALKMLGKKGTVTKVKALQGFLSDIVPHKKPVELRAMVGHFVQLYTFEVRDQKDRKVRSLLNDVLLALATKLRPKAFAPHLRRLLPYWLMAMHDASPEAAASANKALEALFPDNQEMQAEVVVAHASAIMEEFSLFFQHTPETFPGVTLAESDEREERYERCVTAAVLSIDKIVTLLASTGNSDKLCEADQTFSVASVVSGDKFGRLVAASSKNANFTRDAIRKATYRTLKSLVALAYTSIIQVREEYFAKLVLGALSDKHPANQHDLWDMVLTFLQTAAPTLWHQHPGFAKFVKSAVQPRLFAQVRHGFFGSAKTSFPVLLPLLSLLPLEHIVDFKTGTCALYSGVIENAWKFVGSSEGRFYEDITIQSAFECVRACMDFFLRSPTNREAAARLFQGEENVAAYVGAFEKPVKESLLAVFTATKLSVRNVKTYAREWQTMETKLSAATDPISSLVAKQFVTLCHAWLVSVLETLPSSTTVKASHVTTFLQVLMADTVLSEDTRLALVTASTRLYQSCLGQLPDPGHATRALELMNGLYDVVGAHALGLLSNEEVSIEHHYEEHVRPLVVAAGVATTGDSDRLKSNEVAVVLQAAQQVFRLVKDKKAFVLQLFQDVGVQYGDLRKAALVVDTCFRYPFTTIGALQWVTSGSFHDVRDGGEKGDEEEHALMAVWKGKLLDEFVMISLKGRLDDADADAFSSVLQACLGGDGHMPVVSADAVVILSHFVTQQDQESDADVVMRILPTLVGLFTRLSGLALPSELRAAQEQLYQCLFHLAAKSSFKTDAAALWKRHVRPAVLTWTLERRLAFVDSLAETINGIFASEGSAYSAKIWASYVELYAELACVDVDDQTPFALINRLTLFNLGFDGSRAQLTTLYDRLLSCLAELCDAADESAAKRVTDYFTELFVRDHDRGLKLLRRLVDIDICHGLTWAILQSDSMATLSQDATAVPREHVSLGPLYASLATHLPAVISAVGEDGASPRYRRVLFTNQHTEVGAADDVEALDDLTLDQHACLDRLVANVLVSFLPPEAAGTYAQNWLEKQPSPAALVTVDHIVRILSASQDTAAVEVLEKMFARSVAMLPQWPGAAGVEALKVFTTVWSTGKTAPSFDASVHHPLLLKLSRAFAMASQTSIPEWMDAAAYLTAAPSAWHGSDTLDDSKKRWSLAARGLLTHALGGKQDLSEVATLSLQKRTLPADVDDDARVIVAYPLPLVRCRRVVAELVLAMARVDSGESLRELTPSHLEAVLSTLLCGIAEALLLKSHVVSAYVDLFSAPQSLAIIQLAAEMDAFLDAATHTLPELLPLMPDTNRVRVLLLEAFVHIKGLAACFNLDKSTTPSHVRALLYTIATTTEVFQPSAGADVHAGIDINADDEAATEAALAKSLIPAGLRAALKAAFQTTAADASTANAKRSKRKQQQRRPEEEDALVGKLLAWDLFIQLFPDSGSRDGGHLGMRSSALCAYVAKNGLLSTYLSLCGELLSRATGSQRLKLQDEPLYQLDTLDESLGDMTTVGLAARSFFRTVLRLPAMVRSWWNDECSRSLRSWATKYFEEHITPYVLASELDIILRASETHSWDVDEMTVKGSKVSREITTTYLKDECALEMVIRVPSSYPLRSVEVECTRRIGITEDRWRRWVLQIIKVTSAQDGSLLDAVLLWKQNVDKEFEGVEPCPICYSILNPKTMGLPNLSCKTCANKYHNSCLYKWFNQSGKNKCPICQQPFT